MFVTGMFVQPVFLPTKCLNPFALVQKLKGPKRLSEEELRHIEDCPFCQEWIGWNKFPADQLNKN